MLSLKAPLPSPFVRHHPGPSQTSIRRWQPHVAKHAQRAPSWRGYQAAAVAAATALVVPRNRSAMRAEQPEVAENPALPEMVDSESTIQIYPKHEQPASIFEGTDEIDLTKKESRPAGSSEEGTYFWKMTQDKRFIEVIVPVDDWVEVKNVVYRMGEESEDPNRGPMLELGVRYKGDDGKMKETLIIDGQILNAIRREESFWILDEVAGVKVIILTLSRPRSRRQRHDPILKRKTEEERIEPQTWDALLVEDRVKPTITHKIFMDIELEGKPAGRLEFGLFGELMPKTVENFRGLCNGEYTDEEGQVQKSAHCYKGSTFSNIMGGHLIGAGNPGLDLQCIEFSPEELEEYYEFFKDFEAIPRDVGKIDSTWAIRWGADLGLGVDGFGSEREEGQGITYESAAGIKNELYEVADILAELVKKGEGAKLNFYKPEWEKGCDMKGGTFEAESFKVAHGKRGMLTMDRHENQDIQGSVFFITLKEFPQMDKRWVCFGEILSGMELLNTIEEYEGRAKMVCIADCGDLPLED